MADSPKKNAILIIVAVLLFAAAGFVVWNTYFRDDSTPVQKADPNAQPPAATPQGRAGKAIGQ